MSLSHFSGGAFLDSRRWTFSLDLGS